MCCGVGKLLSSRDAPQELLGSGAHGNPKSRAQELSERPTSPPNQVASARALGSFCPRPKSSSTRELMGRNTCNPSGQHRKSASPDKFHEPARCALHCDAQLSQLSQARLTAKEEQMHALIRSLLIVIAAQRAGVDGQSTSTCASVSVHSVFHLNRSRSSRSRPSPSLTQRTALLSFSLPHTTHRPLVQVARTRQRRWGRRRASTVTITTRRAGMAASSRHAAAVTMGSCRGTWDSVRA
jgi:hypothetical protein